jgi:hypothetical protein
MRNHGPFFVAIIVLQSPMTTENLPTYILNPGDNYSVEAVYSEWNTPVYKCYVEEDLPSEFIRQVDSITTKLDGDNLHGILNRDGGLLWTHDRRISHTTMKSISRDPDNNDFDPSAVEFILTNMDRSGELIKQADLTLIGDPKATSPEKRKAAIDALNYLIETLQKQLGNRDLNVNVSCFLKSGDVHDETTLLDFLKLVPDGTELRR